MQAMLSFSAPLLDALGSVTTCTECSGPYCLRVQVQPLFSLRDDVLQVVQDSGCWPSPLRWTSNGMDPFVVEGAQVSLGPLSCLTDERGMAYFDVSDFPHTGTSGRRYTLAILPPAGEEARGLVGPYLTIINHAATRCFRAAQGTVTLQIDGSGARFAPNMRIESALHDIRLAQQTSTWLLIDYRPVFVRSPYFAQRSEDPRLVVLHRTGSSNDIGSTLNAFMGNGRAGVDSGDESDANTNIPHASTHYVVDFDGFAVKMIDESQQGNHTGPSIWRTREHLNGITIGIEMVGQDDGCITTFQVDGVASLVKRILGRWSLHDCDVVGHSDIRIDAYAQGAYRLSDVRGSCPGMKFDWQRLAVAGAATPMDRSGADWHKPSAWDDDVRDKYGGFLFDANGSPVAAPGVSPEIAIYFMLGDEDATPKYHRRDRSADLVGRGLIAILQRDLLSIGYSINGDDGKTVNGQYSDAMERAVERFGRRFMGLPNVRFNLVTARVLESVVRSLSPECKRPL